MGRSTSFLGVPASSRSARVGDLSVYTSTTDRSFSGLRFPGFPRSAGSVRVLRLGCCTSATEGSRLASATYGVQPQPLLTEGHRGCRFGIDSFDFSPDGRLIFMLTGENTLGNTWHVLSATTGVPTRIARLPVHRVEVRRPPRAEPPGRLLPRTARRDYGPSFGASPRHVVRGAVASGAAERALLALAHVSCCWRCRP